MPDSQRIPENRMMPENQRMPENPSASDAPTCEQLINQIEQIARQLESGTLDLDSSLREYERAVRLLILCREHLTEARRKIEILNGLDRNGNAQTTPLDDTELNLQQKAEARGSRRGYKAPQPGTSPAGNGPAGNGSAGNSPAGNVSEEDSYPFQGNGSLF